MSFLLHPSASIYSSSITVRVSLILSSIFFLIDSLLSEPQDDALMLFLDKQWLIPLSHCLSRLNKYKCRGRRSIGVSEQQCTAGLSRKNDSFVSHRSLKEHFVCTSTVLLYYYQASMSMSHEGPNLDKIPHLTYSLLINHAPLSLALSATPRVTDIGFRAGSTIYGLFLIKHRGRTVPSLTFITNPLLSYAVHEGKQKPCRKVKIPHVASVYLNR